MDPLNIIAKPMEDLPQGTRYYTLQGDLIAKTCKRCRIALDIKRFKTTKSSYDGYMTRCYKCIYITEKNAQSKSQPPGGQASTHPDMLQ